ncbi:MAG: AAA family ATPase [Nanoarchaeota archaeon]
MSKNVIMLCGYEASGKSYASLALARGLSGDVRVIDSDIVKEEVWGKETGLKREDFLDERGFYLPKVEELTYSLIYKKIESALSQRFMDSFPIFILDGKFRLKDIRQPVYDIAKNYESGMYVVNCFCSNENEYRERLISRANDPEHPLYEYYKNLGERGIIDIILRSRGLLVGSGQEIEEMFQNPEDFDLEDNPDIAVMRYDTSLERDFNSERTSFVQWQPDDKLSDEIRDVLEGYDFKTNNHAF